ncbi:hypothetical protein RJ639_040911 [Escallonia herrerae]|uniref:GATA transcription factor n=1 Tax=Escallonia herrerae TaxID=1293975 RepID=A0AA88WIU0_9ASTE|nr:hypothetical protein RJ639_040911 [Escallonia herrerae]
MEAPAFFIGGGYYGAGDNQFSQPADNVNNNGNGNAFAIDDLLDFPKEDEVMADAFFDNLAVDSGDSSAVTAVDSCNSSVSGSEHQFSSGNFSSESFADAKLSGGELCVPYDDLAELEWLSNFVEESFSSDDMQNLQLISATKAAPTDTSSSETTHLHTATNRNNNSNSSPIFRTDVSVPGKARSKRSRAAPCDWSSRLLVLSSANSTDTHVKTPSYQKKENADTQGRRCLHCASEKTPQWRTGPMGPKTLCNACGVRYKSGRLVPEYRPASSPTFVSARHSNSHRKVIELRRQKELQRAQHQQLLSQSAIFGESNGEDYLIHRQSGPSFRQMI